MEILAKNEDIFKTIVRCNNCGKPTEYGLTRMIGGFVGCDNKIAVNGKKVECYFGDLQPRVMKYQKSKNKEEHNLYITGRLYRWRDGINE